MLGFEVRVELTNAATGGPFIAQITRGDAEALGLKAGDTVYVRATRVPPMPEEALARTTAQPTRTATRSRRLSKRRGFRRGRSGGDGLGDRRIEAVQHRLGHQPV